MLLTIETRERLLHTTITDIEIINGKACIYTKDKDGEVFVIDCTGKETFVRHLLSDSDKLALLEEKFNLLAEKLGVDIDELIEESYKSA